ncbi:MAG TPA: GH25 family lysozyme, partial [Thermomicrobiales bacterium]|nr:GH25 family lysozyme [Thermomicrobiales bacterium]
MTRAAFAALALALAVTTLAACQQPLPPEVGVEYEGLAVCPGQSTLLGVDVSTYQGTIDWAKVKASGRAFAITRVGDGLGGDNTFDANWAGIKANGMVRGAYQYFRAGDDPKQQADILLGKIGTPTDGDLPPTLDLETLDGQSAATVVANVKIWLSYVKQKTGRTPMIYTSPGFWPSIGNPDLSAYVLWVAHWGTTCPTMPTGWSTWSFHQDSDNGTVPGISGGVDTDVFDGDQAALNAIASNGTPPPPDLGGSPPAPDLGGPAPDLAENVGADMTDTSGNGGNGEQPQPGAAMPHGCSMAARGDVAAPLPILFVLVFAAQLKRRDQKRRRPA